MEFISFTTMSDPSNSLSILIRILWDSLKLLNKTKTLILPLLLISSLSTSLLLLTNYLSTSSLLLDLSINLYLLGPTSNPFFYGPTTVTTTLFLFLLSSTHKLLTNLTLIQSIFTSISFTLHSTLLIATTHLTTMAYLHNNNSPIALEEFLNRIRRRTQWRNPMITLLCFGVYGLGLIFFLAALFALFSLFFEKNFVLLMVSRFVLGIFAMYLIMYLTTVSAMGLLVSVVEEGSYGVEAVGRGMELLNETGRKKQGILVSSVVMIVIGVVYGSYYGFLNRVFPELVESPLVNGFVGMNVGGVISLVSISAYTVLYFECKKSHFDGSFA